MYLVLSACTSSPVSLLANNRVSVFFSLWLVIFSPLYYISQHKRINVYKLISFTFCKLEHHNDLF